MKKKILASVLCAGVLMAPGAVLADAPVSLQVNGQIVTEDASRGEAYINDVGRTMMPLRLVGDYMGYNTTWTEDGRIEITNDSKSVDVVVNVGSTAYTANGEAGTFEVAPIVKDGRTYLPARDFSEIYGAIYWNNDARRVWIYNGSEPMYSLMGKSLVRADAGGIKEMTMPEGKELVVGAPDGYYLDRIVIKTEANYVQLNIGHNHSGNADLYRDNNGTMTLMATINDTSDFAVDSNTIYHTMGIAAGPWTENIVPERLFKTTVGDNTSTKYADLDFAVNTAKLVMEDGKLVATDSNGVSHTIDVDNLDWK